MQAISENMGAIQTPAETGAGASSRPMMDGYNELTQWANDAINANSWRISPDQVLSGESERLLLELAAENNRRLREIQQEVAKNNTERLLKRHRLETLEVIAAYLKLRLEQNRKGSSETIEWPDWSDAAIQGASIPTSEIGRPRGAGSRSRRSAARRSGSRAPAGRSSARPVWSIGSRSSSAAARGRRFLAFELDVIRGGAERCGPDCRTGSPSLPLTSSSRCSEICTTDAAIRGTKTLIDTGDAGSAYAPSGAASTPSRSGPLAAATLKA